ncbi:T9SS type A sorting domain-containing protein [Halosquirtibacter laminarini]|uniref:T9SS type A sorting domain-containing protein n=1 Tax=Halosquirtibacter laminarini TaxID=3374600 RepID=A0AC61NHS2_9BACT|nr:T9SS type A sorting domain-containing protein [Prolixibacteraceae bacterium]
MGKDRYLSFSKFSRKSTRKEHLTTPIRKTEDQLNAITTDYHFSGANAVDKEVEGTIYSLLQIEDFGQTGQVGAPALPMRNDMYILKRDESPSIRITDTQFIEVEAFLIHPALELPTDTEGDSEPLFKKDESIYNRDAYYPNRPAKIVQNQIMRDTRIVKVQICPVQYNPVSNKFRLYSKISYRIDGIDHTIETDINKTAIKFLKANAVNGEDIHAKSTIQLKSVDSQDKDYLILTHSLFKNAAKKLANWKASLGYKVEIISKEHWTTANIRSEISHRYHSMKDKPLYFVLIGDIEQIPSFRFKKEDGAWYFSDLPYACMDGEDDFTPDMAKGRISVQSQEQANIVIDKIINYEKNPTENKSFYNTGLNCAQFQDDERDGYATRRFCHTSEDIRNYVMHHGYKVERIYYTDKKVVPTHFNNGYFSNGEALPSELLKHNQFNWDGGKEDIVKSINDGRFYIFHRDHGYTDGTGWAHPEFLSSHVEELTNGNKLPVVFSINCHTGEFSFDECFAESFLRKKNGGAVAVIGASHTSYSGPNDGLSIGMVEAIWPEQGIVPSFGKGKGATEGVRTKGFTIATNTLGDVLNLGLLRMNETWAPSPINLIETYRMFHLFGDPAMHMWTETPKNIIGKLPMKLRVGQTKLRISNISQEGALVTMVCHERIIAKETIKYGECTLGFKPLSNKEPIDITISAPNCRPIYMHYKMGGDKIAPKAEIIVNKELATVNMAHSMKAVVEGKVDQYEWDFGTNNITFLYKSSKNSTTPYVCYRAPGTYTISLTVRNKYGETTVIAPKKIKIVPKCKKSSTSTVGSHGQRYGMGITNFSFGNFSSTTPNTNIDKGYRDFTGEAHYIHGKQGKNYPVSITTGGVNPILCRVYIDKNNDGIFDKNELTFSNSKFTNTCTGVISIDNSYEEHQMLRVRVLTEHYKNKMANATSEIQYGQVEDYALIVDGTNQEIHTLEPKEIGFHHATLSASLNIQGKPKISEMGFHLGTNSNISKYDTKHTVSKILDQKIELPIQSLKEGTFYYYRSYIILNGETLWGEERTFNTFGSKPDAHVTNFSAINTMSKKQPLQWDVPQNTQRIHGYLIQYGKAKDEVNNPMDGVIETKNTIYVKGGKSNHVEISDLTPNTQYIYKIFPYANSETDILYNTTPIVPQVQAKTLTKENYLPMKSRVPIFPFIHYLRFSNIENSSTRELGGNRFTDQIVEVSTETEYLLHIKGIGITVKRTSGTLVAWFDWNQDGVFADNEMINIGRYGKEYDIMSKIMIPADAKEGKTQMRICYAFDYAKFNSHQEVASCSYEDYPVLVNRNNNLQAIWTGEVSSLWNDKANWKNNLLPKENAHIIIQDGKHNPKLSGVVSYYNIEISKKAQLSIEDGTTLILSEGITNRGTLKVEAAKVRMRHFFIETEATLTLNGGTLETNKARRSIAIPYLHASFNLKKGVFIVHENLLFDYNGPKGTIGEDFTIQVGGNISFENSNWNGAFKGILKIVPGSKTHAIISRKSSSLNIAKLIINAPGEKVTFAALDEKNHKNIIIEQKCDMLAGEIATNTPSGSIVEHLTLNNLTINKEASLNLKGSSLKLSGLIDGDGKLINIEGKTTFYTMDSPLILKTETEFKTVEAMGVRHIYAEKDLTIHHHFTGLQEFILHDMNLTIPNREEKAPIPFKVDKNCQINTPLEPNMSELYIPIDKHGDSYVSHFKRSNDATTQGVVHLKTEAANEYYPIGTISAFVDTKLMNEKMLVSITPPDVGSPKLKWAVKTDVWRFAKEGEEMALTNKPTSFAYMIQKEAPKVSVDNASSMEAMIVGSDPTMEFKLNDQPWISCVTNQKVNLNGHNNLLVRYAATANTVGSITTTNLDTDNTKKDEIALSSNHIKENNTDHTLIGTFASIGSDSFVTNNQKFKALLTKGALDNHLFTIVDNKLYAEQSMNFEELAIHPIEVSFEHCNIKKRRYEIQVIDQNDLPRLKKVENNFVDEHQKGDIILHLEDEDKAHQTLLSCSLKREEPINDFFTLEERDGQYRLSFKITPDFEVKSSYTPVIVIKDPAKGTVETPVKLNIHDVNELPNEIIFESYKLPDNMPIGTVYPFKLVDQDREKGKYHITMEKVSGVNPNLFELKENTLITKKKVDYRFWENDYQYVTFKVEEEGVTGSAEFNVVFRITNTNEAPLFLNTSKVCHVPENNKPKFVIEQIHTVDPEGASVTLKLAPNTPKQFGLDKNFLVTTESLNFEEQHNYEIEVIATDEDGLNTTYPVHVIIDDKNDLPIPIMNGIASTVEAGKTISIDANLSSDEDPSDTLSYQWSMVGIDASFEDAKSPNTTVTFSPTDKNRFATLVLKVDDGKAPISLYKSLFITTNNPNATSEISFEMDQVFPNPCTDHFNLSLNSEYLEPLYVTLLDNTGGTIWTKIMNAQEKRFHIHVPSGIYFIKIHKEESTSVQKLIVQ